MHDFSTASASTTLRLRPVLTWFACLASIALLIDCPLQAADRYAAVISRVKAIGGSPCAQVAEIGRSAMGRPIFAIQFSDSPPADAGDVRVLVMSGQHGDEVSPVLSMLDLAEDLTRGGLPPRVRLVIVPVVNPDGYSSHRRLNSHGADLNRRWGSSIEPETPAVQQLVSRFKPQVVIDLHEWMDRNPLHTNCIEVAGFGSRPQSKLARLLSAFTRHAMTGGDVPRTVFYHAEADSRLAHRHFSRAGICSLLVETASGEPREARMRMYREVVVTAVRTLARSDDSRIGVQLAAVSRGLGKPQPVFMRPTKARPSVTGAVGDIACWIVVVAAMAYVLVRSLAARRKTSEAPLSGRLVYRMPLTDVVRVNLPLHARVALIQQQRVRPSDRTKGIGARVA